MALELKFSKFDNTPWGFRLTGGSDYGMPLTVVKVNINSLSDKVGLKINDIISKINDTDTTVLSHDEAHEVISLAGNNFVATILRPQLVPGEEQNFTQTQHAMEPMNVIPVSCNGVEQQVPTYCANVAVEHKAYRPFSDKVFHDIPPLENPLILSTRHEIENFQTISQQEWKKLTENMNISKHSERSIILNEERYQNSSKSDEMLLDVRRIEETVEEVVENNPPNIVEEKKSVSLVEDTSMEANLKECAKTVTKNSDDTVKVISDECKKVQQEMVVKNCDEKDILKANYRIDVTLEDAKIKAINAANELSHQVKSNGDLKTDTVNAFKTITQNLNQTSYSIPCDATNFVTQSHTDMILKTFFIHLTDVMVALTHMIVCDDANNTCLTPCSQTNCMKTRNIINKQANNVKQTSTTQISQSDTLKASQNINENKHNEVVLKEVIQNIQSATGVDVTVNGKDPLEWLADLDNKEKDLKAIQNVNVEEERNISLTESKNSVEASRTEQENSIKENIILETKESERILTDDIKISEQDIKISVENEVSSSVQEVQQNIDISSEKTQKSSEIEQIRQSVEKSVEQVQRSTQEEKSFIQEIQTSIANIQESKVESQNIVFKDNQTVNQDEIKSDWEAKVKATTPETPSTEEYVFRLDVKVKNLHDTPQAIDGEDLTVVQKRPAEDHLTYDEKKKRLRKSKPKFLNIKEIHEKPSKAISEGDFELEHSSEISKNVQYESKEISADTEKQSSIYNSVDASSTNNVNISNTSTKDVAKDASSSAYENGFITAIPTASADDTSAQVSTVNQQRGQDTQETSVVVVQTAKEQYEKTEEKMESQTISSQEKKICESISENLKQEECSAISVEDISMENPVLSSTMGADAKNFATVNCGIKKLSDGEYQQSIEISNGFSIDNEELGKPGLSYEELNAIMSGNSEELKEQHVIGLQKVLASHMRRPEDEINNTDPSEMTPIVGFLRDSEVFKALNEENIKSKAEKIEEERKKWTTFLQKPNRPVPYCKRLAQQLVFEEPPYKVNIKPQPKKEKSQTGSSSILTEGVFLVPEVPILIPEPTPQYYEAPEYLADSSFPDLESTGIPMPLPPQTPEPKTHEPEEEATLDTVEHETLSEAIKAQEESNETIVAESIICDDNIDESLSMEEQLTKVQQQLVALSKLPATIQQTLDQVTKQLSKMVPHTEGANTVETKERPEGETNEAVEISKTTADAEMVLEHDEEVQPIEENVDQDDTNVGTIRNTEHQTEEIEQKTVENVEALPNGDAIVECDTGTTKNVVADHQNIDKLKKDLMDELSEEHAMRQIKQRGGGTRVGRPRPAFGPLTPQERPIVLPGGRRWKGPHDAFTDSFIAETLSGQAEVIMGKAIGVNFKKYEKPPITLDHLKNSDVYKLIHNMDEPRQGIVFDRPIVLAESEIREKCRSVTPITFEQHETPMET